MPGNDLNDKEISPVICGLGCQAYFARKKGKSHLESGTVCQDYCIIEKLNDNVLVIAVADGHGGDAYVKSDIGAKIACETVVNSVKNILNNRISLKGDTWVEAIATKGFKTKYINMWKKAVLKDYGVDLKNEKEAAYGNIVKQYGTTILFAIVTKEYLTLGQLGDGAILMFNNDNQGQLFKRHALKKGSQTSSLASARAEYAFVINTFHRELFGNLLISTDGIYDKLDMEGSFLTYANLLLNQVRENECLAKPFDFQGIDVSEISKDDCTIALMVSDRPTKKYELTMPPWCGYRDIEFIRSYSGIEIYRAKKVEDIFEIHVSDNVAISDRLDIKNCRIQFPKDRTSRSQGKGAFGYVLSKDLVSMRKLIEYGEHLEKRYWFNDRKCAQEKDYMDTDLYSNEFWLEIYQKLKEVEKEFEIVGICPLLTMFDTAYITGDRRLLFFADTLRQEGFEKEKLAKAFGSIYEYFGIIGKLSCGKVSIPLFRCALQGQNINMLHTADKSLSLCRVIYNRDKNLYGLFNLSGRIWNIEDGKRKEIAPQGVLRLNKNHSFAVKSNESNSVSGAELVDGFAIYKVELF